MPDSMGKRQRRDVKAKSAAAREERRIARNQRRDDRAAGLIAPGPPLAEPEDPFADLPDWPPASKTDDETSPDQAK
jgi:hypothetical protein